MIGNVARPVLALEAAQLNCPTATRFDGLGRLHNFDSHSASAFLYQTDLFRRGLRKINKSSLNERPAVRDTNPTRFSRSRIRAPHNRSQWQGSMRGGHCVHVVTFAV